MREKTLLDWAYYFTTMSFEGTRAYWREMELELSAELGKAYFSLTVDVRDAYLGDASLITEISEADPQHRSVVEGYLKDIRERLNDILDSAGTSTLRWINYTFDGGCEPKFEELWTGTLYDLYHRFRGGEKFSGVPSDVVNQAKVAAQEFFDNRTELEIKISKDFSRTPTDAERRILSYYEINSNEQFKNDLSPYDFVISTSNCVQFRRIWLDFLARNERDVMNFLYDCFLRHADCEASRIKGYRPPVLMGDPTHMAAVSRSLEKAEKIWKRKEKGFCISPTRRIGKCRIVALSEQCSLSRAGRTHGALPGKTSAIF